MADRTPLLAASVGAIAPTLAVTPLTGTFATPVAALGIAFGAAVVAAAVATSIIATKPHPLVQVGAAMVALPLVAIAAVESTALAADGAAMPLPDAWAHLTGSWDATRSGPVPAPLRPDLLALPAVLAATGAWSVVVAARQLLRPVAVIPVLAVFGICLCLTGRQPAHLLVPVALLGACLALSRTTPGAEAEPLAARGERAKRVRRGRRGLLAVIGASVVAPALAVAILTPGLGDDDRTDLRASYVPPLLVRSERHVLGLVAAGVAAGADGPVVFELRTDAPPASRPERVRVAALDEYDGTAWTSSGVFSPAREAAPGGSGRHLVDQAFVLTAAYTSAYLPALDRPVAAATPGGGVVGHDPEHRTLARLDPPGTELRYRVTSSVTDEDLRRRARSYDPVPTSRRIDPGPVADLAAYLDTLPEGEHPLDTLEAMEADLSSSTFGYAPDAAAGHSIGRLAQFLGVGGGTPTAQANRNGTSEQPAAAFAVLARMLGYESRVVVGYDVPDAAGGRDEPVEVTADQAYAWAEVRFASVGWVSFDPTDTTPRDPSSTPPPPDRDSSPPPPQRPTTTTTAPPRPDCGAACPAAPTRHLPWIALVLVALVTVLVARPVVARYLRRSRRRSGPPAQRVVGAWQETRDRLRRHGVPATSATTPSDVADACRGPAAASPVTVPPRWDGHLRDEVADQVTSLAGILDAALYAPDEPTEALARAAWTTEADVAAALAPHTRRRTFLRVLVERHPRPTTPGGASAAGNRPRTKTR